MDAWKAIATLESQFLETQMEIKICLKKREFGKLEVKLQCLNEISAREMTFDLSYREVY